MEILNTGLSNSRGQSATSKLLHVFWHIKKKTHTQSNNRKGEIWGKVKSCVREKVSVYLCSPSVILAPILPAGYNWVGKAEHKMINAIYLIDPIAQFLLEQKYVFRKHT